MMFAGTHEQTRSIEGTDCPFMLMSMGTGCADNIALCTSKQFNVKWYPTIHMHRFACTGL